MTHDNNQPADAADSVTFECELEAPPAQVWRALTEPELLAAWLEPDAAGPAADGRPLRLDFDKKKQTVELETLATEPHRLVRYRWRSVDREGRLPDLESVVTFELSESEAGGTHLLIVHDGFAVMRASAVGNRQSAVGQMIRLPTCRPPNCRRDETVMRLAA